MVLIMTVNPGYGGQTFIESTLGKVRELKAMISRAGASADIEVDGGITLGNVQKVLEAGANVIVSGTSVFKGDIRENVAGFQKIFKEFDQA